MTDVILLRRQAPQNTTLRVPAPELVVLQLVGKIGPPGVQGDPGVSGGSFRFQQTSPSTFWTVNHGLGYRPAVTIEDSGGTVVYADVVHVDANTFTVSLSYAFAGYANCS